MNISLKAPPEPFSCSICANPSFADKEGHSCKGCPAFSETHYFARPAGDDVPDLLVVGDTPMVPDKRSIGRAIIDGVFAHQSFQDDGGKVLLSAIRQVREENENYKGLKVRYVYGVKCAVANPNKSVISSCQGPLLSELSRVNHERLKAGKTGKLVVLACGVTALRSLNIAVQSFEDAAGRVFETSIGAIPLSVVPTMSMAAIAAAVGKYSSVLADVERAMAVVTQSSVKIVPRELIEKNYIYPKTLEEVQAVCEMIQNYSENGVDPLKWMFSFDTETNTLHPHRDGTKMLMVSMSWTAGHATSIALWHPENDMYDPEKAWVYVKTLLASQKPKVLHNAKYDIKVVWKYGWDIENIGWDCMLAEHALEEDKKGQYGLKYLVRQFLPSYSGYEDQLHDILMKTEGEDQRTSLKEVITKELPLPTSVQIALDEMDLSRKFRVSTLEKNVEAYSAALESGDFSAVLKKRGMTDIEKRVQIEKWLAHSELLIAAKKAGEFTEKKEKTNKKVEGGYEKIPLNLLGFYAAVDADATRQLAVLQQNRMRKEDERMNKMRDFVRIDQKYARGTDKRYSVITRCDRPQPVINLVKGSYVPRSRELAKVEYNGISVNRPYLQDATIKLNHVIEDSEKQIYELTGKQFKIGSTAQLGSFLFDTGVGYLHPNPEKAEALAKDPMFKGKIQWDGSRIMYRPELWTQNGTAQVNEATLKIYAKKYGCPLSEAILVYRKAIKARDTFLLNVDQLSSLDGRMHTSYNLNGTSTGRLSSSNMNMQNVPKGDMGGIPDTDPRAAFMTKKEREGVKCKRLFIPDTSEYAFINADAKGAEVSIFSGYAKDPALIAALRDGMDAHCFFSCKVLDPAQVAKGLTGKEAKYALEKAGIDDEHAWNYEDFLLGKDGKLEDKAYGKRLKALRDNIKRVVFGILYGAGPNKIAEIACIEQDFAKTIIELLFGMFPSIPAFVEQVKWELRTFGFVQTYHGRMRRFNIKNAPKKLMAQAERRGVNFEIQAENSDIVLDVFNDVAPVIERDLGGRLLLTVHDSIGLQVPKKYVSQVKDIFYQYGTVKVGKDNPWLPVQYKWDVEAGESYGDLMGIDDYVKKIEPELELVPAGYVEEEMFADLRDAVLVKEQN